jgi:hypothetical protein
MERSTTLSMGKSTNEISMFNSYVALYQRVLSDWPSRRVKIMPSCSARNGSTCLMSPAAAKRTTISQKGAHQRVENGQSHGLVVLIVAWWCFQHHMSSRC